FAFARLAAGHATLPVTYEWLNARSMAIQSCGRRGVGVACAARCTARLRACFYAGDGHTAVVGGCMCHCRTRRALSLWLNRGGPAVGGNSDSGGRGGTGTDADPG